jgi:hypothetical protein
MEMMRTAISRGMSESLAGRVQVSQRLSAAITLVRAISGTALRTAGECRDAAQRASERTAAGHVALGVLRGSFLLGMNVGKFMGHLQNDKPWLSFILRRKR